MILTPFGSMVICSIMKTIYTSILLICLSMSLSSWAQTTEPAASEPSADQAISPQRQEAVKEPVAQLQSMGKNSRKGFFIGFGVGGGGYRASGDLFTFDGPGGVFNFRIGGGVDEKILLMFDAVGFATEENDENWGLASYFFSAQFFPYDNIYVRPGVGFSIIRASDTPLDEETGFAFTTAAGYEFRLGKSFALAPEFNFIYSNVEDFDITVYSGILGFTWYFK